MAHTKGGPCQKGKNGLLLLVVAALLALAPKALPEALVLQRSPTAPPSISRSPDAAPAWMAKVVPNMVFVSIAAATAMATAGGKSRSLFVGQSRPSRQVSCERAQQDVRQVPVHVEEEEVGISASPPANLYELFGTPSTADSKDIKKKYHDLQKLCHPDVAGPEGEEICILLNDAWELLSDPEKRKDYDAQIELAKPAKIVVKPPVCTEITPTWKGERKTLKHHTDYTGIPLSRSRWAKVPPEDRGERHLEEKMLFVDEWACICCRNCCDVAPQTFCIQNDNGRANVYTQWGNSEEYLDYAVASCPVDCIYWVSREELQVLEYVTAQKMVDEKGQLPCPLSYMQGMLNNPPNDPFDDARQFKAKREEEARRKEQAEHTSAAANVEAWFQRIMDVFENLSQNLRANIMIHMKK
ncbi:unnamed protein product [Durusdinium trenchii]|uniref:J domain-containing protein n=1 Tax=Durusdinium trenchii TaxID=1381693 RepID=A0ABP0L2D4_9DINO